MSPVPTPLLQVEHLKKYFPVRKGVFSRVVAHVQAVDDVSFHIDRGETLGLVGESGCGKTTVGRTLLRLIEPTSGKIAFDGHPLSAAGGRQLKALRRQMQFVFQDPYSSLNPRMTVRQILEEGLIIHRLGDAVARERRVLEVMDQVGLARTFVNRYPHEFSGGQRQRIGIARGLVISPQFLVLDEPISALDVSIQAQVVNLLSDLKNRLNLTYLFISHDLSVVEYISDRVAVMYLGEIVETAHSAELYRRPLHPYTQALLSAVPQIDPDRRRRRVTLPGDPPSPLHPPAGCRFHPRCPLAMDVCRRDVPRELNLTGHLVRCHAVEQALANGQQDTAALSQQIAQQMANHPATASVE